MPIDHLHRVHVDLVDIRPLFPVDLDAHKVRVHQFGDVGILKGFMRHDMAPMAGGVADGDEERLVLSLGFGERLITPRVPINRVIGMLAQVEAGLGGKAVWHQVGKKADWPAQMS